MTVARTRWEANSANSALTQVPRAPYRQASIICLLSTWAHCVLAQQVAFEHALHRITLMPRPWGHIAPRHRADVCPASRRIGRELGLGVWLCVVCHLQACCVCSESSLLKKEPPRPFSKAKPAVEERRNGWQKDALRSAGIALVLASCTATRSPCATR